jgi:histone-binding protein RBBP4
MNDLVDCNVQWCPDRASVFGSCAEDGLLNVWDYEKVRVFRLFLVLSPVGPSVSCHISSPS